MNNKRNIILMILMSALITLVDIIKVKFLIKYLGINQTVIYVAIFAFMLSLYIFTAINFEKIIRDLICILGISLLEILLIYLKFNIIYILLVSFTSVLFIIRNEKSSLKENKIEFKSLVINLITNNIIILILLLKKESFFIISYCLYLILTNMVKLIEWKIPNYKIPNYINCLLVILLNICYYRFICLLFPSGYDVTLLGSTVIMTKLLLDLKYEKSNKTNIFTDIIILIINIILSVISLLKFGFVAMLITNLLATFMGYFVVSKENKLKILKEILIEILLVVVIIFFSLQLSFENYKMLIISSVILLVICMTLIVSLYMLQVKDKINKLLYYPLKYLGLIAIFIVIIFDAIDIWKIYKENKEPYVNVLAYHHFVSKEDKERYYKDNEYVLSAEDFEEQLKWLKENDYHPITTNDLYEWLNNEKELDSKSVLITIDDGNISTYYLALPLIEKYGFHAVSFLITSRVGEKTPKFDPKRMDYIGKDVINDIEKNHSSLELGSHSYNLHGRVKNKAPKELSETELSKDVAKSKKILNTDLYCYPFGGRSKNYEEALKENGYKMAFVFGKSKKTRKNDDVYDISRITIDGNMSLDEFARKLR